MKKTSPETNERFREILAMRVYRKSRYPEKFAAELELIEAISEAFGANPINKESREALLDMCITIHEAGKIYGIRAERERRKYNKEEAV